METLAVHSYRGGTGKSNLAANLAWLGARRGMRVAVLDADVGSPGVHVPFGLSRDPGLIGVEGMVSDPADLAKVREELLAAARRARDEPIDPASLEATKSHLQYSFLMSLETAPGVAFSLSDAVLNTGGIEAIEDWFSTLAAVTADDVREAARRYLDDSGLTLLTLVEAGGES